MRRTLSSCNQYDIALGRPTRKDTRVTQDVTGLANRADYITHHRVLIVDPTEIDDVVVAAVERGSNQRIHARRHPHETCIALALGLRDLREQHT
jgi:hypothetical protein